MSACSNTAPIHVWNARYVTAAKLHDQGKYKKAQKHYDQMLKHAPDIETKRLTLYQMALMEKDRGNTAKAIKQFEAIYTSKPIDEHGARSMYWVSRLVDAPAKRLALKQALVLRYPDHISAEHSVHDIKRHHLDAKTPEAFIAWVERVEPKLKTSDLADMLLLIKARFYDQSLNAPDKAIATYRKLYTFKKDGVLADDALWEVALIYRRQKKWTVTIQWLERLVKDIETSWFVGTYNSEFADDARYDMGVIYKDHLKQYDDAIKQFTTFIDEFPTSLLRDDAAWQIVESKRLQGASDYKTTLARFVKEYPESRYIRLAKPRLAQ